MASNEPGNAYGDEMDVKQELARLLEWRDVNNDNDNESSAAGSSLGIADLSGFASTNSSRGVAATDLSGLASNASSRGVANADLSGLASAHSSGRVTSGIASAHSSGRVTSLAAAGRSANSSRGVARASRLSTGSSRGASSVRSGLSGSLLDGLEGIEIDVGGRVTPEAAAARRKRLKEIRAKKNLGGRRRHSATAERTTLRAATSGKYPGGGGLSDGTTLGHRYILKQDAHEIAEAEAAAAASSSRTRESKAVTERVLRTRELALKARQRQKEKMVALEEDNIELTERQRDLESENEQLKLQIKQITEKIFGSVGPAGGNASRPLESGHEQTDLAGDAMQQYHTGELVEQCLREIAPSESDRMVLSPRDIFSPSRIGMNTVAAASPRSAAQLASLISPRRHRT